MPQPALSLSTYLANSLPELQGELPIGTGGVKPRPTWNEGSLKTLVKVDDFAGRVDAFTKSLPDQPLAAHPGKPFPQLTVAARSLNLSSEKDLLAAVKLPLDATLAVVSALDLNEHGGAPEAQENKGPIEADGQAEETVPGLNDRVSLSFGKSPLGETEFIFGDAQKKPVLVVRAVTTTFQEQDWSEFSVSGKYKYNPKSRASWFWSRQWGGTRRLGISHFVLTDYNNWVFGTFDKDGAVANISPVVSSTTKGPTVLEALTYWVRSALGHPNAFQLISEGDATEDAPLFPDNPARRASVKGKQQERPGPKGAK